MDGKVVGCLCNVPSYLIEATYSPTYLPTYLPTYTRTYLPTYLPTYLEGGIPSSDGLDHSRGGTTSYLELQQVQT